MGLRHLKRKPDKCHWKEIDTRPARAHQAQSKCAGRLLLHRLPVRLDNTTHSRTCLDYNTALLWRKISCSPFAIRLLIRKMLSKGSTRCSLPGKCRASTSL